MKVGSLDYFDGETNFVGYLAHPEGDGQRPGIVVFHEAPGLADHPRKRARMLADLGFVALAADMYGQGRVAQSTEEARQLVGSLRDDVPRVRGRTRAALEALAKLPQVDPQRLGAMGYCFGGFAALELARAGAPLGGVVSFHGILSTKDPNDARAIKGKVLAFTGADDPWVPTEQVRDFMEEMTKASVDWQLVTYSGTKHGFTNANNVNSKVPTIAYNPSSDTRSWEGMKAFWLEVFGGRP